jgi:hypothetical protein
LVGAAIVLVIVAALAYASFARSTGNAQTSTLVAYQIEIRSLNHSMSATAGSSILLLFNVTSPKVGPLYFYASAIPLPGSPWEMRLQNVTAGSIKLPAGVSVSYPTGQAVFGTSHAMLALRVAFSPDNSGTVGLVVGVFQQPSQDQVVGTGVGVYVTVQKP